MAQGREFVGINAANVGLIEGIKSFDDVISDLFAKTVDVSNTLPDNRGKGIGFASETVQHKCEDSEMNKRALTEQDIAAIAAGVISAKVEDEPQAEAQVEQAAPVEQKAEVQVDANALAAAFQSQVVAKDKMILELSVEMTQLKSQIEAMKSTHDQLVEIAKSSVKTMATALGATALLEGASDVQVLAEHSRISDGFTKKFRVGGVAAVSGDQQQVNEHKADAVEMARLNAVRSVK
jgi:hypothetical protein